MNKPDKVLTGLKCCADDMNFLCRKCPYCSMDGTSDCFGRLAKDALKLLEKDRAVAAETANAK